MGSCISLHEISRLLTPWKSEQLNLETTVTHRRPRKEISEASADLKTGRGLRTALEI